MLCPGRVSQDKLVLSEGLAKSDTDDPHEGKTKGMLHPARNRVMSYRAPPEEGARGRVSVGPAGHSLKRRHGPTPP